MSVVTKIDPSEMPVSHRGKPPVEEFSAVRALQPGEAIKFPCRWKHWKQNCGGVVAVANTVRNHGFKVSATCRKGTVYVIRR